MKQELKELLKPPFFRHVTDNSFVLVKDQESELLLAQSIRRLGEDGQRYLTDWAVAAMNEKAEREWSEPLRWIIDNEYGYRGVRCPKCGAEYECFYEDIKEDYKYCPRCGQKLLPSKGEKND